METEQPRIEYAISETHLGKLIQIHLVRMPKDTRKHPLKSLNGFRRRMTKMAAAEIDRKRKHGILPPYPDRQFTVQFIEDREAELEAFAETPDLRDALFKAQRPDITHANIFDFYNHIGYSHRTNRFYAALGVPNGEGQQKG